MFTPSMKQGGAMESNDSDVTVTGTPLKLETIICIVPSHPTPHKV